MKRNKHLMDKNIYSGFNEVRLRLGKNKAKKIIIEVKLVDGNDRSWLSAIYSDWQKHGAYAKQEDADKALEVLNRNGTFFKYRLKGN